VCHLHHDFHAWSRPSAQLLPVYRKILIRRNGTSEARGPVTSGLYCPKRSMLGGIIFRNQAPSLKVHRNLVHRNLAVIYLQRGPPIAQNKPTTQRTHKTHSNQGPAVYAFYAFYAWWIYFPQSGALAESTSRPVSHKHESRRISDS
jgi:hypothetical protein